MSYGNYGQQRLRSSDVAGVAIVILIVAGIAFHGELGALYNEWRHGDKVTAQANAKREYQHQLTHADNRIHGNQASVSDGRVYLAQPVTPTPRGICTFRCGTATATDSDYKISLPAGYTYQPASYQLVNDTERYQRQRVVELTYWSPVQHKPVTVRAKGSASITLPRELIRRTVADMKIGERGFVRNTSLVESTPGRGIVYTFGEVVRERGNELYNTGFSTVPIQRVRGGYEACVPDGVITYDPTEIVSQPPLMMSVSSGSTTPKKAPVTIKTDC